MSFKKIRVDGAIHLGHERELLQVPHRRAEAMYSTFTAGPRHESETVKTGEQGVIGEELDFEVSQHDRGELFIEDAGMTTSFGIFGAPGCGKTVMLMYLLEQLFQLEKENPAKRFGALILDPKAALVEDVTNLAIKAGREEDLRILGTGDAHNVIDCYLDPYELGSILVLAGRSAGIDASDPFWFQEWSNLFASSLAILRREAEEEQGGLGDSPVTLKQLLDAIFNVEPATGEYAEERSIVRRARLLLDRDLQPNDDLAIDLQQVERFFRQSYVGTVEAFISKAFGMFRRDRLACYSPEKRPDSHPFYEDIIENGRIVVVSISPSEPALAKTLCTLVKCLFQRTVLARGDLIERKLLANDVRPLVLACDEYSEVASEVAGQSMGDGQFLALARQYGCMAILATQSVNVLEASSLRDTWRSVFSNFAAKVYMRLADNETAEEATKLAGESDWRVLSRGTSFGREGRGTSQQRDLQKRENLPSSILTQVLKVGEAVVIGALDGGRTTPGTRFLKVPDRRVEEPKTRESMSAGERGKVATALGRLAD